MHCLYRVLEVTSDKEADVEEVGARVIELLMGAFLYENRTVVRIRLGDKDLRSDNWKSPDLAMEEPICCEREEIGSLVIGYVDHQGAESDFLPEEHDLVAAVAANLGKMAEDRLLLERVRQAERSRASAEITGVFAHDFNNLLTVIMGSAENLLDDIREGDPAREQVQMIGEAAVRGSAIVAQLLAHIRSRPLPRQAVQTAAMLHDMGRILASAVGKAITVELQIAPDVWPICVDRTQLENALLNLAINARDAMPAGGRLCISATNVRAERDQDNLPDTAMAGDRIRIEVSDTGSGMTDDIAARAFEPFFSAKPHGTGLGLSSVAGFVHQSGGTIELSSEPNHGTTFLISLPRAQTS